jgi:hypothetical protein
MLSEIRQAHEMAAPARAGQAVSLVDVLHIKHLLLETLPQDAAFDAYRNALNLGPDVRFEQRRIASLLDAAQTEAVEYHVLHDGGERVLCEPPEIIGPGVALRSEGTTRTVFVACFENAVAHSRSGAIQLGSELCFDIQGDELDRVSVDMACDPLVFSRNGGEIGAIIDTRPTTLIKLDQAWSLMGVNTVSFGHWMVEGLLQFIGALRHLNLDGVPLLIDQQMPQQHKQSLELLGRGRFPIVEVPRWARVEAGRLWRASNWWYAPHFLITDLGLDPKFFVMPMREVAELYRSAANQLDETLSAGQHDRNLFLARPGTMRRRITNFGEVEAYFGARGFSAFFPEQHSFDEQVRTVREARNIVTQSGSNMHALFLARPGTRVCYLTHPFFPTIALFAELLRQLGVAMKIVSGPFEKKTEPYLDQSDYSIPLDRLDSVIEGWMGKG